MKSIRLRCGQLAITSRYYEKHVKSDWTIFDYEYHQIHCLLCQEINFIQIGHVLWNCQLYCGKICDKIWRLEFRKHQRKCKICAKHVSFRKLKRLDKIAVTNFILMRNEYWNSKSFWSQSLYPNHIRDIILFGRPSGYDGSNLYFSVYFLKLSVEFLPKFEIKQMIDFNTEFRIFDCPKISIFVDSNIWNAFYYHYSNIKRKEYNENIIIPGFAKNCIEIIRTYSYLDSIEITILIINFIKNNSFTLDASCRNFIAEI